MIKIRILLQLKTIQEFEEKKHKTGNISRKTSPRFISIVMWFLAAMKRKIFYKNHVATNTKSHNLVQRIYDILYVNVYRNWILRSFVSNSLLFLIQRLLINKRKKYSAKERESDEWMIKMRVGEKTWEKGLERIEIHVYIIYL
jgi:hypothetical protein